MLTPGERIEEAHGLWELAVVRLAAMVEADAPRGLLSGASADEREAFRRWREVSREAGA